MAGARSLQAGSGLSRTQMAFNSPQTEHFPLILGRKELLGWQFSKKGSPFWQICSLRRAGSPLPCPFPVPGPSPALAALPRSGTSLHFPPVSSPAPLRSPAGPQQPFAATPRLRQSPAAFQQSSVERKETKNKPAPPLPVKTRPEKSPGQPPSQPAAAPAALGSLPCSSRSRPAETSHAGSPEPPAQGRAHRGAGGRAGAACGQGWGLRGLRRRAGGSRSAAAGPPSGAVTASSFPCARGQKAMRMTDTSPSPSPPAGPRTAGRKPPALPRAGGPGRAGLSPLASLQTRKGETEAEKASPAGGAARSSPLAPSPAPFLAQGARCSTRARAPGPALAPGVHPLPLLSPALLGLQPPAGPLRRSFLSLRCSPSPASPSPGASPRAREEEERMPAELAPGRYLPAGPVPGS